MPLLIITVLLQIGFVVHVIKTGRNTVWIWIVMLLPLVGFLSYLIVEILPEFMGSRRGKKASRAVGTLVNPHKDLKAALQSYAMSATVQNAMALAEQYLAKQSFAEARALYLQSLTGMHKTDPYLMFGLAKAEFGLAEYQSCKSVLDNLIQTNPEFKNEEAHLLYAKTLEALNESAAALHEYSVLANYYVGPEAKCRYALLCKKLGNQQLADKLFKEILTLANLSGKHYNSLHKEWIHCAKVESQNRKPVVASQ